MKLAPRFLLGLLGVILIDAAVTVMAVLLGTSGFADALQLMLLVTGLVLVIGGISLSGGLRSFPSDGSCGSSPTSPPRGSARPRSRTAPGG